VFNDFYRQLLESVFGHDLPRALRPRKGQAVGDIPVNAFTKINFGATDYDYTGFVPTDKVDRLVVPAAGAGSYSVLGSWHSGAGVKIGGFVYTWLVNSDRECLDMSTLTFTQGQDNVVKLGWQGKLAAGDYLQLVLLHALSGPLSEGSLKFGTYLSLVYHGAVETTPTPPGPTPTPTPVP
jgi:hypothetical protein